jgi:membrane-bound inhibitor of C-type lysozyme
MERHTVEYTFDGEKLSSVATEHADLTLYRTDEGTYLVHLDQRKSGEGAVLEDGHYPRGLSEHDIRVMWPELLEAQSR